MCVRLRCEFMVPERMGKSGNVHFRRASAQFMYVCAWIDEYLCDLRSNFSVHFEKQNTYIKYTCSDTICKLNKCDR